MPLEQFGGPRETGSGKAAPVARSHKGGARGIIPKDIENTRRRRKRCDLEGLVNPVAQLLLLEELLERAAAGAQPVGKILCLAERPGIQRQARADDEEPLCQRPGPLEGVPSFSRIFNDINDIAILTTGAALSSSPGR